jgi:protein required for attachment to host cells
MNSDPTTWFLIAAGAGARIVVRSARGTGYVTRQSFASADARLPSHELGASPPGRTQQQSSMGRHAIAPHKDLHADARTAFIATVAAALNAAAVRGEFDRLVVIAAPRVAALLRGGLTPAVCDRIVAELRKDLMKVPDHELARHIALLGPKLRRMEATAAGPGG